MKKFLVFVLLLLVPVSASAQIGAGVGVRTCAQFAKDYQNDPLNSEAVYNNWGLGFMSGMNVALDVLDKPRRDLSSMSFEAKKAYMRSFCDRNPLKNYMDGVLEMFGVSPILPR